MAQIFISYSRKDIGFVRKLAGDLEKAGYDVWWDLTDLRGGDDWLRVIPAAIKSSQYIIVALSPNSAVSDWVEKEYTQALALGKKIIPIILASSHFPFALNTINYIDFTGEDYAASLNSLLSTLGYVGEMPVMQKASRKGKRSTRKKTKWETDRTEKLETSVAYPKLLSKKFPSLFVLQYYLPDQRAQATSNIRAAFQNPKINEFRQASSVKPNQTVRVKFFSPALEFSEPVTKTLDQGVNKFMFLGTAKDYCEPGLHEILISITDEAGGKELESLTVTAQVVDFAFDHISRPLLSRFSAIVLGIGSFAMFLLGFLEQIDKTVGVTSGTAAGVLAVLVYGNFYNLYQRMRLNTP